MYALLKKTGGDASVVAVSKSKDRLRNILKKDAARIIREYFYDCDGDEATQKRKAFLLQSLRELGDGHHWDDGEESYLLEYDIVKTRLLDKKTKPQKVVMLFGSEAVNEIYDCETPSDVRRVIEEYSGTDALVVRTFGSRAERRAYEQGMTDIDGWNKSCDVGFEFPGWAKLFKDLKLSE